MEAKLNWAFRYQKKQLSNARPPIAVDQWSEEGRCNPSILGLAKWASRCCVLSHRLSCETLDSNKARLESAMTPWPFEVPRGQVTALSYAWQRFENIHVSQCQSSLYKGKRRWGVHKELDDEETPMFIASQGRCLMGCDEMGCVFDHFLQKAGSKLSIQNSKFMCSKPKSTVHQLQRG